ncbi:MAG: glycogen/starch synthase, partial [Vicinamibacteria bacterium]
MAPLRIAFLSSEVAPFAKTGGLADVARALPRALSKLGQDVRVFMPLYGSVDRARHGVRPLGGESIGVRLGGGAATFTIQAAVLPETEVPIYFVDCPD